MLVREYEAQMLVLTLPLEAQTCPRCGFVTHNIHDVRQQYCGFCHSFLHDEANSLVWGMSEANEALRHRLETANVDCLYARSLPDGRALAVFPNDGEGVLRICYTLRICYDGDPFPPRKEESWIYQNLAFAVNAAATWDPSKERQPYGWLLRTS